MESTIKPIYNTCPLCEEVCGNLFILDCDDIVCGRCLDYFYDTYEPTEDELFICPCCDNSVYTFEPLEK